MYKVFESEESEEYKNCHVTNLHSVRAVKSKLRPAEHAEKVRSFQTEHSGKKPHKTLRVGRIIQQNLRVFLSIRSGVLEVPVLLGYMATIMDNGCSTFRPSVVDSFSNDRNVHFDRSIAEQVNIYNTQQKFQLDITVCQSMHGINAITVNTYSQQNLK